MRKFILLLSLLFCTFSLIEAKKLYVEMQFHDNCIKLDDGSNKKRQTVKNANGENLKFRSLVGALNYMSLQGWQLINSTPKISGDGFFGTSGGTSSTITKVYYIFCKEVSDEELQENVNKSYIDN